MENGKWKVENQELQFKLRLGFSILDNPFSTEVLVPRARLELACLSTLVPKTSAYTNFATSAL